MRITFFISGLSGGGAERQACQLMNYLNRKGHNINVIVTRKNGKTYKLDREISIDSLCKEEDSDNYFFRKIIRLYRLLKIIRKNETDCYIAFLPLPAILLLALKRIKKTKYIYSERVWPGYYSKNFFRILKFFVSKADGIVCQTMEAQHFYEPLSIRHKAVIPNAINDDLLKHSIKDSKREEVIISAGRLVPEKNFALLIDAFRLVSDEFKDYRLCIYGSGPDLRHLKERVREYGLESRVEFIEYTLNYIQKAECASLFVLPSTVEGIPNVLMEAMALGVPCVALNCDGGGAKLLLGNNENGILVENNDCEEMAQAIRTMLNNREYAAMKVRNAIAFIDGFTEEVIYSEWENFVCEVCHI